jgi:hypothetical protein
VIVLWTATGAVDACGITDSEDRARELAGELIASGRASAARVVLRTSLVYSYVEVGVGWGGRPAGGGRVSWAPFAPQVAA